MKTYLEYHDDKSHKFWEISRRGRKVTRRWGRVGATGQKQIKDLDPAEQPKVFVERAIAEKLRKGYVDLTNGFRKLQKRLREEGWYVGWNLPCCQTCAWEELPDKFEDGTKVDYSKVLFNHSQDCNCWDVYVDCDPCEGSGDLDGNACPTCEGQGFILDPKIEGLYDTSVSSFVCLFPEQASGSLFCFDGSEQGVKNLKAILPIIEECGCTVKWDGSAGKRPDIFWET